MLAEASTVAWDYLANSHLLVQSEHTARMCVCTMTGLPPSKTAICFRSTTHVLIRSWEPKPVRGIMGLTEFHMPSNGT